MKCKHKPKDSSWIVSTEYGRYFFFDRAQRCKKCDARINVVHKKCCIALAFVLIVIQLLLLLAWFVAWVIGLKLMFLVLFIGVRYISKLHIGDLVSWNEVVICDREPTPYMEHLN